MKTLSLFLFGLASGSALASQPYQETLRCHEDTPAPTARSFSVLLPTTTLQSLELNSTALVDGTIVRYRSVRDGERPPRIQGALDSQNATFEVKTVEKVVTPTGVQVKQSYEVVVRQDARFTRHYQINGPDQSASEILTASNPDVGDSRPRKYRCTVVY